MSWTHTTIFDRMSCLPCVQAASVAAFAPHPHIHQQQQQQHQQPTLSVLDLSLSPSHTSSRRDSVGQTEGVGKTAAEYTLRHGGPPDMPR
jgi:hypothetical protein